jgi:hypothetical protein
MAESERLPERPDESADWTPPAFTSAPPPRDGMEQRWVRCRTLGQEDHQNVLKRQQQGWTARESDSLPPGFSFLARRFGDMGSVIQNQDSILMERPISVGDRMRQYVARQTGRLSDSIRQYVGNQMPRQHGTAGGAVETLDITSTTGNGRVPRIAGD